MILIIGKKPEKSGIGGVHVNRLLMLMDKFSFKCEFHDLHFKKDILKVPFKNIFFLRRIGILEILI